MEYFSDKERGLRIRQEDNISLNVWEGILGHVQSLISIGAFGEYFPELCPDGNEIVGTDQKAFGYALKAEIPDIEWPIQTSQMKQNELYSEKAPYTPDTLVVLDFIQFCYKHVADPIKCGHHNFFKHHHLTFDSDNGKSDFIEKINLIFARNGISYILEVNGAIKRLSAPILGEVFESMQFWTGDEKLDELLEYSRKKYLNPNQKIQQEAVEKLWDAWERLKSLDNPTNKKDSIKHLLVKTASEKNFNEMLNDEAKKLTEIGNSFHIRHSELEQTEIEKKEHFDYLFHRLLSMIILLTKSI